MWFLFLFCMVKYDAERLKAVHWHDKIKNRKGFTVMKKLLVVIDMQNDFIDGTLGSKEAEAIVDNVVEKIKSYPKDCIYATRDTHQPNYLETQEGKFLPVVHCVENTEGWQFPEKIAKALEGASCGKQAKFWFSAFGGYAVFETLGQDDVEIELVGLCTDICVVSNALLLKAKLPETKIIVDSACCAGVTPESHADALNTMKMCQCVIK